VALTATVSGVPRSATLAPMNRNVAFPVAGGMAIVVDPVEVIIDEDDDDENDDCWDDVVVVEDDDDCWDEVVAVEDDDDDNDDRPEEDIVAEDDGDDDGWDEKGTRKEIDMKAAVRINNMTTTASTIRLINHNCTY